MEEPSTEGNEDNEEVEENEEEKEEETVSADNSLKDYLTDKFNKAMKRIFKNDIKITAIGDSLTQGVGDEEDNGGYVGILEEDRKSTRLNSSHVSISYAVFCLKKKRQS